jgi:RND family efflux transporter MFP subunit
VCGLRGGGRWSRRSAASFLALLMAPIALAGCGPAKPRAEARPPAVIIAHPLQQTVVDWDDYVGQFEATNSVDVRPRVSGYLQSLGFRDGEVVRKGQVLFVIDPRPYQAALDQAKGQEAHAEATLANARTEEARGSQLLAARAISQQAYDALVATERQAAADTVSAKAAVRAAALNLEFTKVIAPLSGRASDRRVAPGNLVTADTTILTNIVTLNPIWFGFTGSEALYLKYQRANQAGTRASSRRAPNPVEIRLQDETGYRWKGHMDFVDNAIDTGSGTIRGRAVIDNPENFLTPGMFGHMRLIGSGPYKALLVPDQAVFTDQTQQAVYVVGSGGMAAERMVELGPLAQGLRVIRAGLTPDDLVIIDGVQRARGGQKVSPSQGRITPAAPSPDQGGYVSQSATSAKLADSGL